MKQSKPLFEWWMIKYVIAAIIVFIFGYTNAYLPVRHLLHGHGLHPYLLIVAPTLLFVLVVMPRIPPRGELRRHRR